MTHINHSLSAATRRRRRVRLGLSDIRPRLTVFRSGKHIYAQIISSGKTLVAATDQELKAKTAPLEAAMKVGELIAQKALKQKITAVTFDRGSYKYHGRVRAVAEGARTAGLKL